MTSRAGRRRFGHKHRVATGDVGSTAPSPGRHPPPSSAPSLSSSTSTATAALASAPPHSEIDTDHGMGMSVCGEAATAENETASASASASPTTTQTHTMAESAGNPFAELRQAVPAPVTAPYHASAPMHIPAPMLARAHVPAHAAEPRVAAWEHKQAPLCGEDSFQTRCQEAKRNWLNLQVLGSLQANDKLGIEDGYLHPDPYRIYRKCTRWYKSYGRKSTIHLAQKVVQACIQAVKDKDTDKIAKATAPDKDLYLERFADAHKGLSHLRDVYAVDRSSIATVQIVSMMTTIEKFLKDEGSPIRNIEPSNRH